MVGLGGFVKYLYLLGGGSACFPWGPLGGQGDVNDIADDQRKPDK